MCLRFSSTRLIGVLGAGILSDQSAIFGPDRFSEDGMAGGLVMMAWADAGYPKKFRVIDIPDIGRYVGRIVYEWENENGQTVRRDKWFHIRWDYSYVPENPAPIVGPDDLTVQGATHPDKTELMSDPKPLSTEELLARGFCCLLGCINCPYARENIRCGNHRRCGDPDTCELWRGCCDPARLEPLPPLA